MLFHLLVVQLLGFPLTFFKYLKVPLWPSPPCCGVTQWLDRLCSLLLLSDSHHAGESAFPTAHCAMSLLNVWVKISSVRNGKLKYSAIKS